MAPMKQRYHTIIKPDANGSFVGWVEEIPGALTHGRSLSECRQNLRAARTAWRRGRFYGYPLCCVVHFCWDVLAGYPSGVARAAQIAHSEEGEWHHVPCGIFHRGDSRLALHTRLWRIVAFQWYQLGPGTGSRALRTHTGFGLFSEHTQAQSADGLSDAGKPHGVWDDELRWE